MPYGETKVYHDGSHYIAIPHTTRPTRKNSKKPKAKKTTELKIEFERLYRENAGKKKSDRIINLTEGLKTILKVKITQGFCESEYRAQEKERNCPAYAPCEKGQSARV